jgi:hypothetical protein
MAIKLRAFLVASAVVTVVAATVIGLSSTPAHAGFTAEYPTHVRIQSGGTGFVMGSLGSARATSDSTAYISVNVIGVPGALTVRAVGRDGVGTTRSCSSTDPAIIQLALSINGDSWISFHWDADGNCTKMTVENASNLRPKTL